MTMRQISIIPLFAALTALGALIRIPFIPVPITLQTFFVLMSGIVLGPKAGFYSQVIYLLIGLMGLPVFAGGGGLSYIFKPSFGYLIGFMLAPIPAGYVVNKMGISPVSVFLAALVGSATIYLIGMTYLIFNMIYMLQQPNAIGIALKAGLLVFLPGDFLKCILMAFLIPKVYRPDSKQPTPEQI
ncbi:MAG: biotin transporter BioY [Deltaproteobacteria bacterium]|nr:biotin transporter BioY [Deltaproteobacteria bacterium]